jgi:hypothetical protein
MARYGRIRRARASSGATPATSGCHCVERDVKCSDTDGSLCSEATSTTPSN